MTDANHVGDRNNMVVGDNDHGNAIPKCGSCGVAWVDHMGIMGVCAENAKLRKERDEARRLACVSMASGGWERFFKTAPLSYEAISEAQSRGWDCFEEKEETQ